MRVKRALFAGVVAGAVMSIFMAIGRADGVDIELERLFGTLVGVHPTTRWCWLIGFVVHLAISGVTALAYAAVFELSTLRAGWRLGIMISLLHVSVVAILIAFVPPLRAVVPGVLRHPGSFALNLSGIAVLTFVVLHAIYGAIVGSMYAPSEADIIDELGPIDPRARNRIS